MNRVFKKNNDDVVKPGYRCWSSISVKWIWKLLPSLNEVMHALCAVINARGPSRTVKTELMHYWMYIQQMDPHAEILKAGKLL